MSTILNVTRWRQDRFEFQAKNPDGTLRNLDRCSIFFGVAQNAGEQPIIMAGIGAGILVTNAAQGKFAVVLPPISKIGLSSLITYYWDIVIIDPTGAPTTPGDMSGRLTVSDGVTPIAFVSGTAASNYAYHPEITTLDGGGVNALDGFDTSTLSLPFMFVIFVANQRQEWRARARAEGEQPDDPQQVPVEARNKVLPAKWDAVTNNVIWERAF